MAAKSTRALARLEAATRMAEQAREDAIEARRAQVAAEDERRVMFEAALIAVARDAGLERVDPAVWTEALQRIAAPGAPSTTSASVRRAAPTRRLAAPRAGDAGAQQAAKPILAAKPAVDEHGRPWTRVSFTSNGAAEKLRMLRSVGLVRNGRSGEWTGYIDRDAVASLRATFGERVIAPMAEDRGEPDRDPSLSPAEPRSGAAAGGAAVEPEAPADLADRPAKVDRVEVDDTPFYKGADLTEILPQAPLEDISKETLETVVRKIVEVEGPIHRDIVCDRIRNAYDKRALPGQIRERIIAVTGALENDPRVADDPDFLMAPGAHVRVRDRNGSDDRIRHFRRLPLVELRLAAAEAPTRDGADTALAVETAVARRLGYGLLTHGLQTRIQEAMGSAKDGRRHDQTHTAEVHGVGAGRPAGSPAPAPPP